MYDDDLYGSNNKRKTILLLVVAVFVIFIGGLYLFLPRSSKQNNPADSTTNTSNQQNNNSNNSNNINSNNTSNLATLDVQEVAVSATLIGVDGKRIYYQQNDKIFQSDLANPNNKKQIAYNIDHYKFNLNNNQIFLSSKVNNLGFIYDTYNQKLVKLEFGNVTDVFWWKLNPYYLIKNDINNTYRLYDPSAKRDVFQANDPVIYPLKDLLLYNEKNELSPNKAIFKSINPISRLYGSDFDLGSNDIIQLNEGVISSKNGQYFWYKDTKNSPENINLGKSPELAFLSLGDGSKSIAFLSYNEDRNALEVYNQDIGSEAKLINSYQLPNNFDTASLMSSKLFSATNKVIEINNTIYLAK